MALTIKANCRNCGQAVEVKVQPETEPVLVQTEDGWVVQIQVDAWDWDLHKIGHRPA